MISTPSREQSESKAVPLMTTSPMFLAWSLWMMVSSSGSLAYSMVSSSTRFINSS